MLLFSISRRKREAKNTADCASRSWTEIPLNKTFSGQAHRTICGMKRTPHIPVAYSRHAEMLLFSISRRKRETKPPWTCASRS